MIVGTRFALIALVCCVAAAVGNSALGQTARTEPSVPRLIQALRSDDKQTRARAIKDLVQLGDAALPELLRHISDNELLIFDGISEVCAAGKGRSVPYLRPLLEARDTHIVLRVISILGTMERDARPAIPSLLKLTGHKDKEVRQNAAWALSEIGDSRAIPALVKLSSDDPAIEVRKSVLQALRSFGPALADHIKPILHVAQVPGSYSQNEHEAICYLAFGTLSRIGSKAVPYLIESYTNPKLQLYVRFEAIDAIADMGMRGHGADAKEAIPTLTRMLADRNDRLRLEAAYALVYMGPQAKPVVRELEKFAASLKSPLDQENIACNLIRMDPDNKILIGIISRLLSDKFEQADRLSVLGFLVYIPPDSKGLASEVGNLLGDRDPEIRIGACKALATFPRLTIEVVGKMHECAKNDLDSRVRQTAKMAIGQRIAIGILRDFSVPQ